MVRDKLISLLQHLRFAVNIKKSILQPLQEIEFLDLQIDFQEMIFTLSQEKSLEFDKMYQVVLQSKSVTLQKLASLIGSLCSAAEAALLAFPQVRYF